ncbi:hypothetical protein Q8G35_27910 [Peribacillus simplex]|uniref:Uncharacterized protein n=2 Tax=Peribacillus TaxID=2675229 RepID=A0AA90PJB3_9BACI|nr:MULTISPECIES: hypothetical protein [Peribacillus]MDP1422075.1 hypothetical protein [Peribacillus simplex]MDP1454742.1 hypothetical protein [Peribacillus frigoritolerans]
MSDYRKKMFRGAKVEDCILDFIDMEKELSRTLETADEQERQLLLGMSKAYRLIVNRLVREFDYPKGGDSVNVKIKELISSLKRRISAAKEESKNNLTDLVNGMYYADIPEEAKDEIAKVPQELHLFEGMAVGYEKIIIDLELLLESSDHDKISHIEISVAKYKKIADMLKDKFKEDEGDLRSGYIQGEMAAYVMIREEIQIIFNVSRTEVT